MGCDFIGIALHNKICLKINLFLLALMSESLERLLAECTVKIIEPKNNISGTGFFVAPGFILTCNHVVSGYVSQKVEDGENVNFIYKNKKFDAKVFRSVPGMHDLALLEFDVSRETKNVPCVRLHYEFKLFHAIESNDLVYSFGYPYEGFTNGSPVTSVCEGLTGEEDYIKLKDGQIQSGMSGSALLNQSTGMVCGIIKLSRNIDTDLGGGAIHAKYILHYFPELKYLQRQFHQHDHRWKESVLKGNNKIERGMYKLADRDNDEQALLVQSSDEVSQRLTRSIFNSILIDLAMELQPKQVDSPYDIDILTGPQPDRLLSPGISIVDVFDRKEISGRLLILGQPGIGKTIELLRLADVLVDRSELIYEGINQNGKQSYVWHPVPTIFNLSSWKLKESINDWMIRELFDSRGVPRKVGKKLVERNQILPLLDGLDELDVTKQRACILELNKYIRSKNPKHLVICCRQEVYEKLDFRLILNGAVSLKELGPEKIKNYLYEVNQADFWNQVKGSQKLMNLLETPFLLSISVIVVDSDDRSLIDQWKSYASEKECISYLLDSYIDRMFSRKIRGLQNISQLFRITWTHLSRLSPWPNVVIPFTVKQVAFN